MVGESGVCMDFQLLACSPADARVVDFCVAKKFATSLKIDFSTAIDASEKKT